MPERRWLHDGTRPLLPILIFPPEGADLRSIEATALVDTGATASAVTSDIADRLNLPVIGKRLVASAHGDQHVERYLFRIAVVPDEQSGGAAIPYIFEPTDGFRIRGGFQFDALIGMDVLKQCDLELNRNGWCSLRLP